MEPKVDFIIIGAQKAGTTALFDYMGEHPQIGLSDVKEVHFFDDEARDWDAPDYDAYHAHFNLADRSRRWGEATPIYLYWKNSIERIAAYNPRARLIILLRDPVERAWSHWKMEFARGAETNPFAWCIRQGRARLFDADPWGFHREFSYVERGFYGEQIARVLAHFPAEQLLILQSNELDIAPEGTLRRISLFLDAPPPPPMRSRRVHEAQPMTYPSSLTTEDVALLRRLYGADMAQLADLTGLRFW
ncbi:MAG: sulfotransferase [Phenylobacterium sp.]|uniref:sulfotransferase family protein n=1 Tax=Phenylobacterium sp. TaxID=1871053 RepID=UPI0027173E4A|nr:sulfotransferase [Phenylobacterium sp.]MDO8410606.1 sulfotransferase [Phenylobacterium sp.]